MSACAQGAAAVTNVTGVLTSGCVNCRNAVTLGLRCYRPVPAGHLPLLRATVHPDHLRKAQLPCPDGQGGAGIVRL
jgi:hypothetical protein